MQSRHNTVAAATDVTDHHTDSVLPTSDMTSFPALTPIRTKAYQSHDQPASLTAKSHAPHAQPPPQRLSPRASLDLSLHPENGTSCIVRILSEPLDAMYEEEDTVIEDPTLVAVLEHAMWQPNAHPVLHVPLPISRRTSQHGDIDSEADESLLSPARSEGVHQLSQPLLQDGQHSHHSGSYAFRCCICTVAECHLSPSKTVASIRSVRQLYAAPACQ